tara:strand:- start:566 stop:1144 length:579 start_codon:yes stop_codon:yes gene_type:complete
MSILSDLYNRNLGGGNWQKRFGIEGNLLATDTFNQAFGAGEWENRFGLKGGPKGLADSGDWLTKTSKWYNQLGGREFDEAWGGGAWMDPGKRNFLGLDEKGNIPWTNINLFKVDQGGGGGEEGGGGGDGDADTSEDAEKLARGFDLGNEQDEKDRLARMRRMLAGRYGRAETNLTGGTGFGSGSQRTLGGYS